MSEQLNKKPEPTLQQKQLKEDMLSLKQHPAFQFILGNLGRQAKELISAACDEVDNVEHKAEERLWTVYQIVCNLKAVLSVFDGVEQPIIDGSTQEELEKASQGM